MSHTIGISVPEWPDASLAHWLESLRPPAALLDSRGVVLATNAAWREAPRQGCPALSAGPGASLLDLLRQESTEAQGQTSSLVSQLEAVLRGERTLGEALHPASLHRHAPRTCVLTAGMDMGERRYALVLPFQRPVSDDAESLLRWREALVSPEGGPDADLVCLTDATGRRRYVSSSYRTVLGYDPADLVGRPLLDILHPSDRDRAQSAIANAARQRAPARLTVRTRRADGGFVLLDALGTPLYDDKGALAGGVIMCRDVTGQALAEEERQRSEQRFRHLVESMADVVWEVDAQGRILYVSPQIRDLLGLDPEALPGRSLYDVLSRPHARLVRRIHDQLLAAPRSFRLVRTRETHRLGHVVHLETSGAPVLGPSGEVEGFRCVTRDVSEIVRAEEAVRESEERFRHLYHRTPGMLQTTGPDGLLLSVSDYWLHKTGYARDEVIGRRLDEFLAPPSSAALQAETASGGAAPGAVRDLALQLLRKDGELLDVLYSAVEERDLAGGATHWLGVLVDVTERNALERQLLQAQKMESIGRLAGGMAHDFNNLLTVILGYADLAEQTLDAASPARHGLQRIRQAAERAARLTGQMLTVARRQPVEPQTVNLNDLMLQTGDMLTRVLGEDVQLSIASAADLWPTRIDTSQFEQVLMNLVVNARDACSAGGRIRIETANADLDEEYASRHPGASAGPHVEVTVSDTGCGMTAEVLAHVFEPFFTTKEPGRGTGLGLATCYGIVTQAGGHIRIVSQPGEGTKVHVYLPRASGGRPATQAAPPPTRRVAGETVLLVEDDPLVREAAAAALRQEGYTVLAADSPEEAIRLAASASDGCDLLITDLILPGMSGRRLAELLVARRPHLPVLYVSGYADVAPPALGPAFLPKPFAPADLLRAVRAALDGDDPPPDLTPA